jgi:hypothetical protein
MKTFVERMLARVFAVKAHEPSLERMTAYERREAAALAAKPVGMTSPLASASSTARYDATVAMGARDIAVRSPLADDTEEARRLAEQASVKSGSHLRSELVDGSEAAALDALDASHHEPPRSELADDTEEAREAARRASERSEAGDKGAEEREAKKRA